MQRCLTTRHHKAADVEFRLYTHQPRKMTEEGLVPNGDPYTVIEMYHRNAQGDWGMIASVRECEFLEIVDDVSNLADVLDSLARRTQLTEDDADNDSDSSRRIIVAEDQ